ncbi:hypothetical protein [Fibrobacter sp. UWB2]|uniref:hypothetical protein n=1 Tax=Fibrobacter sp. UWB2 TaxID=1964358 RepID=UPI0013036999|nr:hypothetical protein [Fibrobacter sp. UWB2]
MIIWPAFWRMDMEFHKGMSSSGKLYGFGLTFADGLITVVSFTRDADELEVARFVESFARFAEELLTAGVICRTLDEDGMTHIETSEELDSGIYRSI